MVNRSVRAYNLLHSPGGRTHGARHERTSSFGYRPMRLLPASPTAASVDVGLLQGIKSSSEIILYSAATETGCTITFEQRRKEIFCLR